MVAAVAVLVIATSPLPTLEVQENSGRIAIDLLRRRPMVVAVLISMSLGLPIGMYDALWARYLTDLGARPWLVGVSLACYSVPFMLLAGVGGILRDVFTMGARPVALLNALRFGDPSHEKTKRLVKGVVSGIGGYGNCVGVPTVGGEVRFHRSYNGNCLVNAMTVGIAPMVKRPALRLLSVSAYSEMPLKPSVGACPVPRISKLLRALPLRHLLYRCRCYNNQRAMLLALPLSTRCASVADTATAGALPLRRLLHHCRRYNNQCAMLLALPPSMRCTASVVDTATAGVLPLCRLLHHCCRYNNQSCTFML